MHQPYFAYGSNMCSAQLSRRVPNVRATGRARLPDYRLVLSKRGADGSAKANVEPQPGGVVWGVVYTIEISALPLLDRFEGGYQRRELCVHTDAQAGLLAHVYVAERLAGDGVPFDWYKRLLIEGAREHALPDGYVDGLIALPERSRVDRSDGSA